ncbi:MAG: Glu/Leu/Phe/Val dehydrogenase dimerization domain-containing protein [Acidimicrobiia bacterium]
MPTVRGNTATRLIAAGGHEQVLFVGDGDVGLRAIIAIHSTALGPSLGGVRFWRYDDDEAALRDALRLSEAMTHKAAMAGLHQGGGKAVVLWDDPDRARPPELLHALGRAIDGLGGRYLAAEDVGATTADMDGLAEVTPWVTGVSESLGGSGDPSPVTAFGVLCSMRAALHAQVGKSTLRDRRVMVQGAGHVGSHLARLLADEGAEVLVADRDPARAASVAAATGATAVDADHALTTWCDVLAPCALGGILTEELAPLLRCRVVVGAANNQLLDRAADEAIAKRGILVVPDFVASAGGIVNIAREFTGYDRDRAYAETARIEDTTARVIEWARHDGVTPTVAALAMARQRVATEGVDADGAPRRWRPGDPAAWTAGRPLTRLRG